MSLGASTSGKLNGKDFPGNILSREDIKAAFLAGDAGAANFLLGENIRASLAQGLVDSGKKKDLSFGAAKQFLSSSDFAHLLSKTLNLHPAMAAIGFLNFILESDNQKNQQLRAKQLVNSGALRKLEIKKEVAPSLIQQVVSARLNPEKLRDEQKALTETVRKEYDNVFRSLLEAL